MVEKIMECACIDMSDDGEPTQFHHCKLVEMPEEIRNDLKLCNECSRPILPKEKFELAVMKFEGLWTNHCTCTDCMSVRKAFFCQYIYGCVWEALMEEYNGYPEGFSYVSIPELTVRAREMLCDKIEQEWEEEALNAEDEE